MKYAFISDIHANIEALLAVKNHINEIKPDRIVCLGDIVGYNPDPDTCTEVVFGMADYLVRGNHDKAASGLMDMKYFNEPAREVLNWTQSSMTAENMRKLSGLQQGPLLVDNEFLICHGAPMDEDRYVYDATAIRESIACMAAGFPGTLLCFFGHTHIPAVIPDRGKTQRVEGTFQLERNRVYLINPGSVGQPRDGNPKASWGLYDSTLRQFTLYRVDYASQATQAKIVGAGLPDDLARRLGYGK